MKFTWFNLMPWPYLPDDFREKNRSVWVDIDSRLFDPAKGHEVYNNHLDLLEYASTLGFDGIGCNEHHQNAYGLMPSPNLIAASLARRTKDVALVVLGNSIALYNPPIRVAEEFAMLDCISGGRLVAGFPVGTSMDTNFCYGQIPSLTREKYLEAHDLIIKAWREPDPVLIRRDLGLAYFEMASASHAGPDLLQAYQILSQLPSEQRQDPAVEADLGSVLLAQAQTQLAIRMFSRASAQQPSNARYVYCLGTALEHAGKTEEAVKELKRSIELDPSRPDAYLELAELYKKAGRETESRNALREYLRFMPQNLQLRLTN